MSFDWQTEDDETAWIAEDPSSAQPSRRRAIFITIAIGLAVTIVTLQLYVNRFVSREEDKIVEDVAAAYDLIYTAEQSRDNELFTFLLSATDPDWNQQQRNLLNQGRLLNHSLPGWSLEERSATTIELSPNFSEAEVTQTFVYANRALGAEPPILQFEQSTIFRRGVERWLYTVPREMYWGESKSIESENSPIDLQYYERDEAAAEALHQYLNRELGKYQLASNGTCLNGNDLGTLSIELEHSPELLQQLFVPPLSMRAGRSNQSTLTLPSHHTLWAPARYSQ